MAYFTKYVCIYQLDKNNTLLFNTLTSAIDVVDNNTVDKIKNMIKGIHEISYEEDQQLYNMLKRRGYIFELQQDEQNILNYFHQKNNLVCSNTMVTNFKICPTLGCNLRCVYCYESHKIHQNNTVMSDEQLNTIFRYIQYSMQKVRQYKNRTPIHVGLFGGEPLLESNYNVVEKVLKFAKRKNIKLYITTNGTTVNRYYNLLIKYRDIAHLQITLDGNKYIHDKKRIDVFGNGTFENICNGIDMILNAGIHLNVRINLDKDSINSVEELKYVFEKRLWDKNCFFSVYATPIRNYNEVKQPSNILNDSEILDVFIKNGWYSYPNPFINLDSSVYDMLRIFSFTKSEYTIPWQVSYCSASQGSQFIFTPDGRIYTCLKCTGEKNYSIGHFDKDNVIIEEDKLNSWKKRTPFDMAKCKDCKFILLCAGGCPYYALKRFGNINCPVCNDIEKTLEVYVKHNKEKFLRKVL